MDEILGVKNTKSKKKKMKKSKLEKNGDENESEAGVKLLLFAELGDEKRLKKLLKRHKSLDINVTDTFLQSGLHKAAEQGHEKIIQLLLRYNANPASRDMLGNTTAHTAAFALQMACFTTIMLAHNAPDMELPNECGVTIRAAMQRMVQFNSRGARPAGDSSLDTEWEDKLQANAEYDREDMDHFSGFADLENEYDDMKYGGNQDAHMDEDEYARKIWEEMNRRKHGGQRPSEATAETWAKADAVDSHAQRVRQAAEDAKQRSRKILDEEQAKDKAWRQAVAQGDLGVQRASYEAKWHAFSVSTAPVRLQDIPWLADDGQDNVKAVVLYGTDNSKEVRQRLKLELMRWHPDKFQGRFGHRIDSNQRQDILDKVKSISQILNSLLRQ